MAALPGCGDDDSTAGTPTSAATGGPATTVGGPTPDCVLSPELSEGPFYLDLDLVRRDITEGRSGLPLDLRLIVVDAAACEAIRDAAVDVWHCDAAGEYSGVEGGGEGTFLRGIQVTDAQGAAEFRTIYPGWYSGRAVHIHVKVHLGGRSAGFTGQLFFDDELTAGVYAREPYASRPGPDVTNDTDGIYRQGGDSAIVTVVRDGESYTGSVTLGVQRA